MDKVVHFEIPADNVKKAKSFYQKAFGWKMEKIPMGKEEFYFVGTVTKDKKGSPGEPGAINGDLSKRSQKNLPITIVVNVTSIKKSLKKIEKLGGKVVVFPQKIGTLGIYARVKDTEGNLLGLWQDVK